MVTTFLTTASVACLWQAVTRGGWSRFRWLVLAGIAAGFGALAKGLVPIIVLAGPALVALVLMIRDLKAGREAASAGMADWKPTVLSIVAACLLVGLIALPWLGYIFLHIPQAAEIWRAESLDRAAGDTVKGAPVYYYLARLSYLVAPWTVFFVVGLVVWVRAPWKVEGDRAWPAFVGTWFFVPLIVFSVAAGKRAHYMLPLMPAAAAFAVIALEWLLVATSQRRRLAASWIMFAHAAVFVALAAALAFFSSKLVPGHATAAFALAGILAAGAVAIAILALKDRLASSAGALAVAFTAAFLVAWPTVLADVRSDDSRSQLARRIAEIVPANERLLFFRDVTPALVFYTSRTIPLVDDEGDLAVLTQRKVPFYLICKQEDVAPVAKLDGMKVILDAPRAHRKGYATFALLKWTPPGLCSSSAEEFRFSKDIEAEIAVRERQAKEAGVATDALTGATDKIYKFLGEFEHDRKKMGWSRAVFRPWDPNNSAAADFLVGVEPLLAPVHAALGKRIVLPVDYRFGIAGKLGWHAPIHFTADAFLVRGNYRLSKGEFSGAIDDAIDTLKTSALLAGGYDGEARGFMQGAAFILASAVSGNPDLRQDMNDVTASVIAVQEGCETARRLEDTRNLICLTTLENVLANRFPEDEDKFMARLAREAPVTAEQVANARAYHAEVMKALSLDYASFLKAEEAARGTAGITDHSAPATVYTLAMCGGALGLRKDQDYLESVRNIVVSAVAIRKYVISVGKLPESLADVKRFIADAAMLNDPFAGKLLRYSAADHAVTLWSIGPNLKDDGGKNLLDRDPPLSEGESDISVHCTFSDKLFTPH
jgi:hypothetical protein